MQRIWSMTVSSSFTPAISANINMCCVPRTNTQFGDRSFAAAGPRLWNSLPARIRQPDNDIAEFHWQLKSFLAHSKEWANAMARCPSSVRPSVCKLLRKSLLLADKWPDRHQTCTRWTPGQRASRVCLRSRSRSKVTWYAYFFGFLEWATPSFTVWLFKWHRGA